MNFKRIVSILILPFLIGSITACSHDELKTPNQDLPSASAASTGCAAMDKVFEAEMKNSSAGREFLQAIAIEDKGDDMQKTEERSEKVLKTWLAFLADVKKEEPYKKLKDAAGDDPKAAKALQSLDAYTDIVKKLTSGEVTQFPHEEEAKQQLELGETPEENPEFVRLQTEQVEHHNTLSECMPSWPVTF
ncbi:MAG: hypothetical protein Q4P66_05195 [Actinomycetaceae bacterium]|nr:hypothetical protein [Actinomycetaceae bacterium]MDO5747038.1 hypothetical protein [Actinomycetaceae bacterium]